MEAFLMSNLMMLLYSSSSYLSKKTHDYAKAEFFICSIKKIISTDLFGFLEPGENHEGNYDPSEVRFFSGSNPGLVTLFRLEFTQFDPKFFS
jgi:hypothetical protein